MTAQHPIIRKKSGMSFSRIVQPPRDLEAAVREVRECLERQLPQGLDNAARHIVACIEEWGR